MLKRLFDVVASGSGLILLSPLLLALALAVKLGSPGPIFYRANRVGRYGKHFKLLKFRSMVVNADRIGPAVTGAADPRITRVGRFLRRTKLDELPQLINVLKGDMSLVGPRPTSWQLDKYTLHQTERLTVQPGITGLWQVCARESKNFDERLLWDLQYIEKISLWLDMQILIRTAFQAFKKGV